MEKEAEETLAAAQAEFEKMTKKHNALVEKYNELQDLLNRKSEALDEADEKLEKEREAHERAVKHHEEQLAAFQYGKEDLRQKVTDLSSDNESLNKKYLNSLQEAQTLKAELDQLYASKFSTEQQLTDKLEELMKENERLRQEMDDAAYRQEPTDLAEILDLQEQIKLLNKEVERLRGAAVSKSIHFHNNFVNNINVFNEVVNNQYIETILKHMNTTNVYIKNLVQSADLQNVKQEFVNQLKRYDDMRERNIKLMKRVHDLSHNIQVCARTRPPDSNEAVNGHLIIDNASLGSGEFNLYDFQTNKWTLFEFDQHWSYDATQTDVFYDFEPLVASIVPNVMELAHTNLLNESVKHSSIISYGGKESGKTFTMHGFGSYLGLSYRSVQRLFEMLDFQHVFLQHQQQVPLKEGEVGLIEDMFYKYSVTLSMMEVFGDTVRDILVDGTDKDGANLANNVVFDSNLNQITVTGLAYKEVGDVEEALSVLANSIQNAYTREEFASREFTTTFIVEVGIVVQYHPDEPAIRSKLYLTDICASDADNKDKNVTGLEDILKTMASGESKPLAYESCALMSLLRCAISYDARLMMVFNFSPTDISTTTTKANLDLAMSVRSIKRDLSTSKQRMDQMELKMVELKMKTVTTELREQKKRNVTIQESLSQTKSVAEDMIIQFNERNKLIYKHYNEEKQITQQLQLDLDLTHRNLKRSIQELHEQRNINERLVQILKALEKERQAAINE